MPKKSLSSTTNYGLTVRRGQILAIIGVTSDPKKLKKFHYELKGIEREIEKRKIILSKYTDRAGVERARKAMAKQCGEMLSKPYDHEAFTATVAELRIFIQTYNSL